MKEIFINLKRFDVPKKLGGICPMDDPKEWIHWVIEESVRYGLGQLKNIQVTYFLPESLIISAVEKVKTYPDEQIKSMNMGSQGVFREDVKQGGNFGAFTTNLPAAAVKNMGCSWSIIGHSEERRDKLELISRIDPAYYNDERLRKKAAAAVDSIINEEVLCALEANINVLLCIGETAAERGSGSFEEQQPRIKSVLQTQLQRGLRNVDRVQKNQKIVIGYEPIWAIGPGKTPPGAEYIEFVSTHIKQVAKNKYDFNPVVVYGGGLKEANAEMIARIESIGGGLIALTKFTEDYGFEPGELKRIIEKYIN